MHIFLAIALLVSGGLGVSVAADNALPGDILYGVKTEINERARSSVAFTTEASAQWEARRAERRLSEAERLAARGALNAETDAELASRLDTHVDAVSRAISQLEARSSIDNASRVVSNFEAALSAHEQALTEVSGQSDTRAELVLERLQTHLAAVSASRARIEARVVSGAEADVRAAAEHRKQTAERAIANARALIDRARSDVSAGVVTQSESRIEHAESLFVEGESHLEAELYADAFRAFQSAHRVAQETFRIIHASQHLGISIGAGAAVEARGGFEMNNNGRAAASQNGEQDQAEHNEGEGVEGGTQVEIQGEIQLEGGF